VITNIVQPFVLPVVKGNVVSVDFSNQKDGSVTLYDWDILTGSFVVEKGVLRTTGIPAIASLRGTQGSNFRVIFKAPVTSLYLQYYVGCKMQVIFT